MNRNLLLLILAVVACFTAGARQPASPGAAMGKRQAELITALKRSAEGTGKVRLQLALADLHWTDVRDYDSVAAYAAQACTLSRAIRFDSGYNEATFWICRIYVKKEQFAAAQKLLPEVTKDQQVRLLIVIGEEYLYRRALKKIDLDTAYQYFSQSLRIARELGTQKWKRESLLALGKYYFAANEFRKAKGAFLELVDDYRRLKDTLEEAHSWSSLGTHMPHADSTFKDQMEAHEQARRLFHMVKDTNNERSSLEDMANANLFHANLPLAKKQYLEALHLRRLTKSKRIFIDLRAISFIAHAMGDHDEALAYALESEKNIQEQGLQYDLLTNFLLGMIYSDDGQTGKGLQYFLSVKKINDLWQYFLCRKVVEQYILLGKPGEALAYVKDFEKRYPAVRPSDKEALAGAKGDCYAALNNTALAEKYYLDMIRLDDEAQKLKIREVSAAAFTITGSEAYHKIAHFYTSRHKYTTAAVYLDSALKSTAAASGKQFYTTNLRRKIWWLKFKVDSAAGNHLAAIRSYEQYTALNDSIFTDAKAKQLQRLEVGYETRKKEMDIKARDQQIKGLTQIAALRQANLKQATFIRNITMGAVLVLLVLGALLYRQYRHKQQASQMVAKQNAQLQHLLTEKEWLLKEVHHRVKNNLHTIICLLESQAVFLENDALKAIENSQHRVYAMSLIHQKLYQADNVKTIEMADYLPEFISYLKQSFGTSGNIVFELDIDPLQLDVSRAIPIALIINEAVTNSIKYAFPGNRKGLIRVSMHTNGEDGVLEIADNGIGIKEKIKEDIKGSSLNSLGMELMKGLSEDINGYIEFENDHGTKITVSFTLDPVPGFSHIVNPPKEKEALI
jgi:two-component sensor histidine kinase